MISLLNSTVVRYTLTTPHNAISIQLPIESDSKKSTFYCGGMHKFRLIRSRQKMLDSVGIPHFGVLQASSDKLSPTKLAVPAWKAPWEQAIIITTLIYHERRVAPG